MKLYNVAKTPWPDVGNSSMSKQDGRGVLKASLIEPGTEI